MRFLKLIDSNWVANLMVWIVLAIPLVFFGDLCNAAGFSKGLVFFGANSLLLATAVFTLTRIKLKELIRHPLFWIMVVWFLIMVLATIFSTNSYLSFWGTDRRLGGLFTIVNVFVLLIILYTHLTREFALKMLKVMATVGGLAGLYILGQKLGLNFIASAGDYGSRPDGTFGNPIFLSSFLVMVIFFTLYFAIVNRNIWYRMWYWLALGLELAALFWASTRGCILGVLVGIVVLVIGWVVVKYSDNRRRLWMTLGAIFAAGVILIGGAYVMREPLGVQRLFNFSLQEGSSLYARYLTAQTVWQASGDKPLLGYGPENVYVAYDKYYSAKESRFGYTETFSDRAHNVVLDQLITNGWLGLVAMLVFVSGLLVLIFKWWRQADGFQEKMLAVVFMSTVIAYFVQDLAEFDMITNYVYGAILIAILLCLSRRRQENSVQKRPNVFNVISGLILLALSIYLIFGVYQPSWRGSSMAKAASQATLNSQWFDAEVLYDRTFKIKSPYSQWYISEHYGGYVNAYAEDNFRESPGAVERVLEVGIRKFEKFIEREPEHIQMRLVLAGLNGILDDLAGDGRNEGDRLFQELIDKNPNREFFYFYWGKNLYLSRRVEEAREKLLQAASFESVAGEIDFWLGVTEATLGNEESALEYLHSAATKIHSIRRVSEQPHLIYAIGYLVERDKKEDAAEFQRLLIVINPQNRQYWLNLAVLYRDLGQIDKARVTAQNILRRFPETHNETIQFINSL